MENAVNIMAMVQGNSIVKKKFDVPSKPLGNDKTNFRKELNQARKDIKNDYSFDTKDVEAKTQSTTEKKTEKFAKMMSSNNAKAEVKKDANTEVKDKPSVDVLEQTDAVEKKTNLAVDEVKQIEQIKQVEQIEEEIKIEEPGQAVLDMLQQLIQMMENLKVEGTSNQQFTELKTVLQNALQVLEQTLEMPTTSQPGELNKLLSSLKNGLTELVSQLEVVSESKLDSKQTEQLMNQLSDNLKQAKALNHQVLQKTDISKKHSEVSEIPKAQVIKVESKEFTTNSDVNFTEATDENKEVTKTDNSRSSEDKSSDSQENEEDVNAIKSNVKREVLQTTSGDKLSQADVNKIVAQPVEKENFQLNIKQANVNLQKESQVKINTSDIINQVIKKADIFVQGSHQEMVMKLEPESLGKLNLKIVVENGIVTAKFIAESQQVKEVLESSFNQLKNALQEKGITVQGFSVSVGQQGAEFNSGKGFEQWKRTIKLNNKTTGEYMKLDEENSMSLNPYNYHEGKVDYRA